MILGLDCALKTGYAILDSEGKLIDSGVWDFRGHYRQSGTGSLFFRFKYEIERRMEFKFNLIGVENVHHRGAAATKLAYGYLTILDLLSYFYNIPVQTVHSQSLKKWVTGYGRAEKSEMIKAAEQFKGSSVIDDNEADSILISKYFYERLKDEK